MSANQDSKLLRLMWRKKVFILVVTLSAAIFSLIYTLSLPNLFKSTGILVPVNLTSGNSNIGSLGSLSSMVGINIDQNDNKKEEALEFLTSYKFFNEVLGGDSMKLELFAVNSWDSESNEFTYDSNIYDVNSKKWTRRSLFGQHKGEPSMQETHKAFLEMLTINESMQSGFVYISFEHLSPYYSQEIVENIIQKINKYFKDQDEELANNKQEYLTQLINQTSLSEMRDVLANLIKQEIQIIAVANSVEDYVFKVLEPPIIPEKKSKPMRSVICILLTFGGFILAIIYLLIYEQIRRFVHILK